MGSVMNIDECITAGDSSDGHRLADVIHTVREPPVPHATACATHARRRARAAAGSHVR
jgi:hypothetical protein